MRVAFYVVLNKDTLETYTNCYKKQFNMQLNSRGVYSTCRRRNKKDGNIKLISATNYIDLGLMLDRLPKLSQLKEIIILKVYLFIELRQIRGT